MVNIISQTLQELKPNLRTNGFGIANAHRKISLFIPPSTKSPLFVYGSSPSQRSFLSLGTDYESEIFSGDGDDYSEQFGEDGGELSRTVSLPSQISDVPQEPELDWLLQEHERRYSSIGDGSTDEESISDEDTRQTTNYHGYQDDNDNFTSFISRIRQNQQHKHKQKQRRISQLPRVDRRNSRLSIGSLSVTQKTDEDFSHEKVTTYSELIKIIQYSIPLILTFVLENVFSLVCVLVVSHLGKDELAAVSLANMMSNIIFAVFEGLSTSLDTLCPQAFGAGDYHTVGIHFQRCSLMAMVLFIPFGCIWWWSNKVLQLFISDDDDVINLATLFLRWMLPGAPAYIIFENLKRYLQAQGIFEAGTYVLFVCAPLNIVVSYVLVWDKRIGLGFIGAPIATVLNFWLMLILLTCYTIFIDGKQCWGGFSKKSLKQWKSLFELAIPGVVMLEAESLSYEVLTLFASYFGTSYLATQSAVSTLGSLLYMIPFSVGIASSTRIANFIGAKRIDCAELSAKIGVYGAIVTGVFNSLILIIFKKQIAHGFSQDEEVIQLILDILPIIAIVEVFDSMNAVAGSCLRGQGMQRIGSYINLIVYYFIAIPLAWIFGYYLNYKLVGLWLSMGFGFFLIGTIESWFVLEADWQKILDEADERNRDSLENELN